MAKCRAGGDGGGGGGCPDYMLTYGDMMSLLLCFFVIIVSLSKIKEDDQFRMVMNSLRKAFGYSSSRSVAPGEYADTAADNLIEKIQNEIIRRSSAKRNQSDRPKTQRSQVGKSTTVRNIRDGLMFTVGGMSLFEEGQATLMSEAQEELKGLVKLIKGYRNKVVIRGHTSRGAMPAGSPFADSMALSYARARAVMDFLLAGGIREDRLNLEACGGNEPVEVFCEYDQTGAADNRRVEIIVKDTMVEDYVGDKKPGAVGG